MMQLRMSTADANKPENSFLNRYRDVKPYDHSRVKLETHHDTDYINASLVTVSKYEVFEFHEFFVIRLR
jgi:protein tyrosine phosphatase